ncbi:MAG TPA: glucan 1,4-alpha-glucosidase [Terriglobales bacterium]|nr:glucan 1,4-alpha-glucosidase [Terriglobales bacterium]
MSSPSSSNPPGAPGIPPRWTSSAKSGVGTALSPSSRVWFTLSHGIVNEIYFPRVDIACTRDLGLIVTDGRFYFSEEKRHAASGVNYLAPGVPAYRLVNTAMDGRYRIEKEICTDPCRHVCLQKIRFQPLQGQLADYHVYVLLAPHLANFGYGNTGFIGDYKGTPMLYASRDGHALALASSTGWLKRSAGYVGTSDGWQDLFSNYEMTWEYPKAENGNVALTGEVDLAGCGGEFVLSLGFGQVASEAGAHALASLLEGYETVCREYVQGWQDWLEKVDPPDSESNHDMFRISACVLRTHEEKTFPGGIIASLSIPWGFSKGDEDLGGYHLVWPRDLVETASGLLAFEARQDAVRVLGYLRVTQESDGHWPQNMWLDGTSYWQGIQMDETALPILLVDLLRRESALSDGQLADFWPMVRRAAGFVVRNGPVTQQDRWEEDPGYSPFTLAAEIAGLLVAAELAEMHHEPALAVLFRETADAWNANIERWIYQVGGPLARKLNIDGYYVRVAPPDTADPDCTSALEGYVPIKNRPPADTLEPASSIVSPDALALVRFGLRAPDDPRIISTVKAIDALLKVDLPQGPSWHRYNDDGYGEHEDGSAFDGTGTGRAWPLLTGERAHYELAAGRRAAAESLLHTMEKSADESGLIPEQVWDAPDIPPLELFFGRPSGSARPLVWAHAEYLKLRRSLRDGKVFDQAPQTYQRYVVEKQASAVFIWSFNHKVRSMPPGLKLRLQILAPASVHWSADAWRTAQDTSSTDTGVGVYLVDLHTDQLPAGSRVVFTFYWTEEKRWEGTNFEVCVE